MKSRYNSRISSSRMISLASGNRRASNSRSQDPAAAGTCGRLRDRVRRLAVEEIEPDVAVGIVVLDHPAQALDHHVEPGFLEALPGRGLGRGLSGLAFAPGELPVAGVDGPRGPCRTRKEPRGESGRCRLRRSGIG